MNRFKKDDPIYIPTYVELKFLGWKDKKAIDYGVFHDDFEPQSFIIHEKMYNEYGGTLVTVDSPFGSNGLYWINEDNGQWSWPLDLLNKQWIDYHGACCFHEEGMTAINGWIICKLCGDNLREIK